MKEPCPIKYFGPSMPAMHGVQCQMDHHPHPGLRHYAMVNGNTIWWWTAAEKEKLKVNFN